MNIFFLHHSPQRAAESCIDRHVVKMPSESCIMVANAYTLDQLKSAPKTKTGGDRRHSWKHHGCTRWMKRSLTNFNWLLEHSRALCAEYTYRYEKVHFCEEFINWCRENPPSLPNIGWSTPYLAMPNNCKCNNPTISYRRYYVNYKQLDNSGKLMFFFSKRGYPDWISDFLIDII